MKTRKAFILCSCIVLTTFLLIAGSPAEAGKEDTDADAKAFAPIIVHDFGVILFPVKDLEARPTCALQAPGFVFTAYEDGGAWNIAMVSAWEAIALRGDGGGHGGNLCPQEDSPPTGPTGGPSAPDTADQPSGVPDSTPEAPDTELPTPPVGEPGKVEGEPEGVPQPDTTEREPENRSSETRERDEGPSSPVTTPALSDPFLTFYPVDDSGLPGGKLKVDVTIGFGDGKPFYWYPRAKAKTSIEWDSLVLSDRAPREKNLPKTNYLSFGGKKVDHWYADARRGDSLYALSGDTHDKVLFYGGITTTSAAIHVTRTDDTLFLTSRIGRTLKDIVLISKRGKDIFYARVDSLAPGVEEMPVKALKLKLTVKEFADEEASRWGLSLRKAGLFAHEADCVVKMMRRDLLETDGTRAIYLATGPTAEIISRITIEPRPVRKVTALVCAVLID